MKLLIIFIITTTSVLLKDLLSIVKCLVYKPLAFQIHKHFLEHKKKTTRKIVEEYIKSRDVQQLLFIINNRDKNSDSTPADADADADDNVSN